jgi:hypothetical protein
MNILEKQKPQNIHVLHQELHKHKHAFLVEKIIIKRSNMKSLIEEELVQVSSVHYCKKFKTKQNNRSGSKDFIHNSTTPIRKNYHYCV